MTHFLKVDRETLLSEEDEDSRSCTSLRTPYVKRCGALILACLCLALGGSYFMVAIFSLNMQRQFNLSQSSVEVLVGIGFAASNIGYPWGLLLERMSERVGFLLALLLGTVSASLLYSSDYMVEFYSDQWWLLVMYWAGLCSAFNIAYLIALSVSLSNYPEKQHGRVSGYLQCSWWLGQTMFYYLYTLTEPEPGNPTGNTTAGSIFLYMAISVFLIYGLSAFFVYPIPISEEMDETKELFHYEKNNDDKHETIIGTMGLKLFCNIDFHLVCWTMLSGVGAQVMYVGNTSSICRILDFGDLYDDVLPIAPIYGLVFTFLSGLISDCTLKVLPRATFITVTAALQAFFFGLSLACGDHPVMFVITTLQLYASIGIYYSTCAAIISERLGFEHFKRNWGIVLMVTAAMYVLISLSFAVLYDDAALAIRPFSRCTGFGCMSGIFICATSLSSVSFFCSVLLVMRHSQ